MLTLSSTAPRRRGALLILMSLTLLLLSACNAKGDATPDSYLNPGLSESILNAPVITDEVDQIQAPMRELKTVPAKTPEFYATVNIALGLGDKLAARWYHQGKHLAHLDSEIVLEDAIDGWAAFPIASTEPWPKGNYKVEIWLNGQKAADRAFQIK